MNQNDYNRDYSSNTYRHAEVVSDRSAAEAARTFMNRVYLWMAGALAVTGLVAYAVFGVMMDTRPHMTITGEIAGGSIFWSPGFMLVMVLVFALAAALCLRVFVFSDQASERNEAVDRAVLEVQNAAETLKSTGLPADEAQKEVATRMGGTMSQGLVQICYDEAWNVIPENSETCAYVLEVQGMPAEVEGLVKVHIRAAAMKDISVGGSGESLFAIDAAWQEVSGHE